MALNHHGTQKGNIYYYNSYWNIRLKTKKTVLYIIGLTYSWFFRDLTAHERSHSRVKLYECEECQVSLTHQSSMVRHYRTVHKMVKTVKTKQPVLSASVPDNSVSWFIITFPVWLRNRLISAGLESVHSHTKKSCIAIFHE